MAPLKRYSQFVASCNKRKVLQYSAAGGLPSQRPPALTVLAWAVPLPVLEAEAVTEAVVVVVVVVEGNSSRSRSVSVLG